MVLHDASYNSHTQRQQQYRYSDYLEGITGDQVARATQASQGIRIVIDKGTKIKATHDCFQTQEIVTTRAEIMPDNFGHDENRLYIALDDRNSRFHALVSSEILQHGSCTIPVRVKFELKYFYFESLHQSVQKLPSQIVRRILPEKSHFIKPTKSIKGSELFKARCKLSSDQELALDAMLSAPSSGPPFLLSGPFGTGKTFLLASVTHCFFEQGRKKRQQVRVFIGTQQHISAENFLKCFIDIMLPNDDVHIVRLTPAQDNSPGIYSKYNMTTTAFEKELDNFEQQYLCLVVSTCMTSKQLGRMLRGSFTHILLDEGANLREPEAVIPLQLAGPDTKIVIAGDKHQVSSLFSIY